MSDRPTPSRSGDRRSVKLAANAVIPTGRMIGINTSGFAVPMGATATLKSAGVAHERLDNTGGIDGAITADAFCGIYRFANSSAGDLIGVQHIGQQAFAVTDAQVALTNATNTRPAAGTIFDVDAQGVWVRFN